MGGRLAAEKTPGQNVVCTIGDGGFNMNIQELQTFKNYKINAKTFIINNHVYGITKAFQMTNFEGRMEACGPVGYNPPDFMKICEGFDVPARRVIHKKDMREAMQWFLDCKDACVLEVMVPYTEHVLPMIPSGKTYKDVIYEGRQELKAEAGL